MSLALIQESAKEVRRLAIAGSPLAVGDFRLKKLIAPLEQAGAKAPVFAQVAKAIGDLVNGKEADSSAQLLQLSTLLNAILYTQGQTTAEADYRELEVFATSCSSTRTTARVLKPLIEALTNSGGGRFEVVKAAFERGSFNDLRLIDPAIKALDDNYPELADLVAEKILPAFGPGIVPRLKEKLDLKGKRVDGRRLKLMHQVDPAGTLELCKTALEGGSPDVKVSAIECLGQHEECLPLVQEQVESKNKALRAAALEALAAYDRPDIAKIFTDLIKGKALDLLAKPFRVISNRQVLQSLLAEGQRVLELVVKGDAEQLPRFAAILDCIHERKDPECEEFLLQSFGQCEKLAKVKPAKNAILGGADLVERLAALLSHLIGSPKALEAVLAKRDIVPTGAFSHVLGSALRVWPAGKIYQEFAPLLEQKKGAGRDKSEQLQELILASVWDETSRFEVLSSVEPDSPEGSWLKDIKWDPRWLEAAIKADHPVIVCCLARPGHKAAIDYLLKAAQSKKDSQPGLVIQALARCQYPKVSDFFLELVIRHTKNARYLDYEAMVLFESAQHLPPADLPKLEAAVPKLDEKFADHYLQALAPLRGESKPNE
jgi:hypothetical protein